MGSSGKGELKRQVAGRGVFASVTVTATPADRGLAVTLAADVGDNPFVDAATAGIRHAYDSLIVEGHSL
jgi:hypothetical protein